MLLAEYPGGGPWEINASDLSTRVLDMAGTGIFPMERTSDLPREYLHKYCLKGTGPQEGVLMVPANLRSRVCFEQVNLTRDLPNVGLFDVIFLRNVMISFDKNTKCAVAEKLLHAHRPGGHFLIGHTETLHGIDGGLETIATSINRKPVK